MDNNCSNCRHFKLGSVGPTRKEHIWGDCLRVKGNSHQEKNADSAVNFTWADACCGHFEPIEPPQECRQENDSE